MFILFSAINFLKPGVFIEFEVNLFFESMLENKSIFESAFFSKHRYVLL